jgi:hypothetical protein
MSFPSGTIFSVESIPPSIADYDFSSGWIVNIQEPGEPIRKIAGPFGKSAQAECEAQRFKGLVAKG